MVGGTDMAGIQTDMSVPTILPHWDSADVAKGLLAMPGFRLVHSRCMDKHAILVVLGHAIAEKWGLTGLHRQFYTVVWWH